MTTLLLDDLYEQELPGGSIILTFPCGTVATIQPGDTAAVIKEHVTESVCSLCYERQFETQGGPVSKRRGYWKRLRKLDKDQRKQATTGGELKDALLQSLGNMRRRDS